MTNLITALILAIVVAGPNAAWAECAWLAWQENETMFPGALIKMDWLPPVAFTDRDACAGWIDRNVKNWELTADARQTVMLGAGGMAATFRTSARNPSDGWTAIRVLCLPDTVDPRGPHGN